jgi:hypothetical protein
MRPCLDHADRSPGHGSFPVTLDSTDDDVPTLRRIAAEQRVTSQTGALLAALPLAEGLERVARLVVPLLADACAVLERQPDGGLVVAADSDNRLVGARGCRLAADHPFERVMMLRRPLLLALDGLGAQGHLRERTLLCLPLARNEPVGLLLFGFAAGRSLSLAGGAHHDLASQVTAALQIAALVARLAGLHSRAT